LHPIYRPLNIINASFFLDPTAAVEKQKFVYIMNRDANNKLTISSPLEAHKAETIIFSVVGVDVGFDNPIFALIELEYKEADQDPTGKMHKLAQM
jgi:splicing factor 3B subunit 3